MLTEQAAPRRANTIRRPGTGAVPQAAPTMPPPRKKKWNKKRLAILLISGLAIILTLLLADRKPESPPVAAVPPEKPEPKVVDCKTYPFKHYSKKLNDRLPEYRHLSLKAGVPPIHDE